MSVRISATRFTMVFALSLLFNSLYSNPLPVDTLEQLRVEKVSSLPVKKNNRAEFVLRAFFPTTGNALLRKNMSNWLNGLLSSLTQIERPDVDYAGEPDGWISYYEKAYLKRVKKEIGEQLKLRDKDGGPINYVVEVNVKRAYETAKLITYQAEAYAYGGGAHGMSYTVYASFRKSDGRLLTWNDVVLGKQQARLSPLIVDGLSQYFGMTDFTALKGRLQIEGDYSRTKFPLPQGNPGLSADGLHVQYGLYEIAPYAAGAPSVSIPYTRLKNILTPVAKQMIK